MTDEDTYRLVKSSDRKVLADRLRKLENVRKVADAQASRMGEAIRVVNERTEHDVYRAEPPERPRETFDDLRKT